MEQTKSMITGVAVALGAASVATPEAAGATMYTESDLHGPGAATQFVALVDADLHRPPRVLFSWGSAMPAGHNPLNVTVDSPPGFDAYALMGIADDGGVFVTFADPAVALGRAFDEVFPGFSEASLADALLNDPQGSVVVSFLDALDTTPGVGTSMGTMSHVFHFSLGADYGAFHASFTPIPAPGSALLACLGGAVATARRRRRSG